MSKPSDKRSEGITRKRIGKSFFYYYISNEKPVAERDMKRINKLRLPPAWENIWISKDPGATIQATGMDNKNRKQYRYHEKHIKKAEEKKFVRLYKFIQATPKLNKMITKHLKLHPYDIDHVIVTMLEIIKKIHIRVGKECYVKANKSYGISSLRKHHVKITGDLIVFKFKGKSNKRLTYSFRSKHIKQHLKALMKLEGDKVFQYLDDCQKVRSVSDKDLNMYIQKWMGPFTCKDFRTYAANFYFVKTLLQETKTRTPKSATEIKRNLRTAFRKTSFYLRHTKNIAKKSYVIDFVRELYLSDPGYFYRHRFDNPNDILLKLLKLYKSKIIGK
jgi:DNA topoisomerase I